MHGGGPWGEVSSLRTKEAWTADPHVLLLRVRVRAQLHVIERNGRADALPFSRVANVRLRSNRLSVDE